MNKKAAIELSVGTIIILIIAVTVLGLILGFTTGMFEKATTPLDEKLMEENEPVPATARDPTSSFRKPSAPQMANCYRLRSGMYCSNN